MTRPSRGRSVGRMLGTPLVTSPLRGLVQRLQDWPVASQLQARRNAMIASTACAQRRAERQDVADYLAGLTAPTELAIPRPSGAPTVRTSRA